LIDLFRFFKETIEGDYYHAESYKNFFKGMLRMLLVLLHDFPDFLIESSFTLIENLPKKFNQVKNIVLSAFPTSMKPPDPFRTNDQVEIRDLS
jgi:CCR4-NOT transcription complex subunit 1